MTNRKIKAIGDAMIMASKVLDNVSAIFKYEDIKEIMKYIIKHSDIDICTCSLDDYYDKDFYLAINDNLIYLEKAETEKGYLYSEDDVMITSPDSGILDSTKFSVFDNFILVDEDGNRVQSERSNSVKMFASIFDMMNSKIIC